MLVKTQFLVGHSRSVHFKPGWLEDVWDPIRDYPIEGGDMEP
jgi:hypothetical protein